MFEHQNHGALTRSYIFNVGGTYSSPHTKSFMFANIVSNPMAALTSGCNHNQTTQKTCWAIAKTL